MMPDPIVLALGSSMMILAFGKWRTLARFIEECSHCEGWIRRDEMATEAQAILRVMCDRRVA